MILNRVKAIAVPSMRIPKPQSTQAYEVVGWRMSRGEEAVVYRIPMQPGTRKASEKRIQASAFVRAFEVLTDAGEITRSWFKREFPELQADGTCNFTTLGGIFELLGEARYVRPGIYRATKPPNRH
jgi:hypothetical protein